MMGPTETDLALQEPAGRAALDREAVPRVGTNDAEPVLDDFEVWYRAIHPRIVAALTLSTGRLDDAAEVADETLVRALERWTHVRTMASPDGWAFRVAFNLVRRRGRRQALERTVLRRASAGRTEALRAVGTSLVAGAALVAAAALGFLPPGIAAILALAIDAMTLPAGARLLRRIDLRLGIRS